MRVFELCEKYFCCPRCNQSLTVQVFHETGDGLLLCENCRYPYLIFNNIPVMLPQSLVPQHILRQFLNKYPQAGEHFHNRSGEETEDLVKVTQINTWGAQYSGLAQSPSFHERVMPTTTRSFLHDLFYPNSKKLLWERLVGRNGFFLELGCGEGAFTSVAAKNFAMYFGMDISIEAIEHCYRQHPYKNCVFFVGDAENVPLREGLMEACAAQWLFEHLANPGAAAREMVRVLKPGGVAYVDTNHTRFLLTHRWFQMVLTPKKYWRRMEEAGHSHDRFFTKERLVELFKNAGLCHIQTGLAYFTLDMLVNNHLLAPLLAFVARRSSEDQRGDVQALTTSDGMYSLEFEEKTDFSSLDDRRQQMIRLVNQLMEALRLLLVPDRLLEFCGQGESVILVGTKPPVEGQEAAGKG